MGSMRCMCFTYMRRVGHTTWCSAFATTTLLPVASTSPPPFHCWVDNVEFGSGVVPTTCP
jgi:hypothetical protein